MSAERATLRVLIADDEQVARRRLTRLLGAMPGIELAGECARGDAVLEWLARPEARVDVLLLDIRMPGISGLEARALIPDDGPYVIFTTAHAEHALEAFEVGAVDYLLKPIEAGRLSRALARARRALRGRADAGAEAERDAAPEDAPAIARLAVPTAKGILLLDPADITHALFDGALVTVFAGQGPVIADGSLGELEKKLEGLTRAGARFERVHRRALLNLDRLARLEPVETGGFVAYTDRDAAVPVSRQVARRLRKRLGLS
ncbi:MAG: response regulator transcription factor [Myxococcales bacterium]|nr:response regulator transcription factor [Myxococcales bacterium]